MDNKKGLIINKSKKLEKKNYQVWIGIKEIPNVE